MSASQTIGGGVAANSSINKTDISTSHGGVGFSVAPVVGVAVDNKIKWFSAIMEPRTAKT